MHYKCSAKIKGVWLFCLSIHLLYHYSLSTSVLFVRFCAVMISRLSLHLQKNEAKHARNKVKDECDS